MKPVAAIVEPAQVDVDLIAEQIIVARAEQRQADSSAARHDQLADAARATAKAKRLQIGGWLAKIRAAYPERGPNAAPWGAFLKRVDMAESTARMYIDEYRDPDGFAEKRRALSEKSESGPRSDPKPANGRDVTPDNDPPAHPAATAVTEAEVLALLDKLDPAARKRIVKAVRANVAGGSGETARGTWCTPKAVAEDVGPWDLDPLSNPRSHIVARIKCSLEGGGDGLRQGAIPGCFRDDEGREQRAGTDLRVWIQPPYELVLEAVAHYGHTRFCALLRFAPDTEWFEQLIALTTVVAIPLGWRMDFEPPPGVEESSNPYPHALYYRDERDVTDRVRSRYLVAHVDHTAAKPTLRIVRNT